MSADTGLKLTVYSAETEPDSPSADGLSLLASWAATKRCRPPRQSRRGPQRRKVTTAMPEWSADELDDLRASNEIQLSTF